jgi:hypothetical protein
MRSEKEIKEVLKQVETIYKHAFKTYECVTKSGYRWSEYQNEVFAFRAGLEFALGVKKANYWFKAFQKAKKEAQKRKLI